MNSSAATPLYYFFFSYRHGGRWKKTRVVAATLREALEEIRAMQNVHYERRVELERAEHHTAQLRRMSADWYWGLTVVGALALGYVLGVLT